ASLPLLVMAVYMYGIRSLIMVCVVLVTAVLCDVIACKMIGSQYNSTENSSLVIAMILTLLMPANIEYY
ncbi:MAG: RnfABCDGE type electron transport complex subunit D, partial [Oscillospiraceae bacterium]